MLTFCLQALGSCSIRVVRLFRSRQLSILTTVSDFTTRLCEANVTVDTNFRKRASPGPVVDQLKRLALGVLLASFFGWFVRIVDRVMLKIGERSTNSHEQARKMVMELT